MLVLSREENQSIRIYGPAVITVLKLRGTDVSLGIEADRDVLVLRTELEPFERAIAEAVRGPDLISRAEGRTPR